MHNFEFVKPASVAEAVKALGAEGAQALSGGQTLISTMKQRLAAPTVLVSLTGIASLKGVSQSGKVLTIGAATTHAEVAAATATSYPALSALAGAIGDPAVRSRGTIGGSLANNDPAACYPAGVLGSGATVVTSKREIAADDYFQGLFSTALEEGEIITAVRFPIPDRAAYAKFLQPASRFSLTSAFVTKTGSAARVAITGASENGVFRWSAGEAALSANYSAEAVKGLKVNEADMIADLHGTKAYRANLVRVMTGRAVAAS
jgi:aerobic carbon-monoxide dehydrogenase medium subunit